jgi:hypothetical protein
VRRGNVRASVVLTVTVVAVSSCGSPAPTHTASPKPSSTTAPRPSAAAGPCASVTTTTAIGQVPAACAAAWAPYGVTKVPPANLTDSTPVPPSVVNGSHGSVTDTDAQSWALAANRAAIWLRWSEANDQFSLTSRLEGPLVVNSQIDQLMRQGVVISDPDCNLFAQRYVVSPMTPQGRQFFASFAESTNDQFVLEERYPGPCSLTATFADGHTQTLFPSAGAVISVVAGAVRSDPLMGDIWYITAGGFCTDRGAPTEWCS